MTARVAKNSRRGSKPGERRGGRKAGTPNKATASVKAALTSAFEKRGGVMALVTWAAENPTEFYKLWAKMLPQEVTGKDGEPIAHTVTQVWQFGAKQVAF